MHACGIRPQDQTGFGHVIGTLRLSVIRSYLSYKDYEVEFIENVTDVDNSDIYREGLDLVFLHQEKAQCEAHNNLPFVKYWMHCGLLNVDGVKMSKSFNNAMSTEEGPEKYGKELITWVVLRHHYRSLIDLNDQLFRDNLNVLRDLYMNISPTVIGATIERPDVSDPKVKELVNEFEAEMDNDFNTPGALVLLSHYLEEAVSLKVQKKKAASKRLEEAIVYLGRLLGLFLSENLVGLTNAMLKFQQQALRTPEVITVEDIDLLIKDREKARENKEFAKADHVCNLLKLHGIAIMDGADKNRWKFTAN
jgi:cysteinyl-tRNA synthetase